MAVSRTLMWKLYAGLVGAATALAVTKALDGAWKLVTGSTPPDPADPLTPTRQAVTWAAATAVGAAVASVLSSRVAAASWERALGEPAPRRRA